MGGVLPPQWSQNTECRALQGQDRWVVAASTLVAGVHPSRWLFLKCRLLKLLISESGIKGKVLNQEAVCCSAVQCGTCLGCVRLQPQTWKVRAGGPTASP